MDTRKKATIGVIAVIVVFLIWQISAMFGGESEVIPPPENGAKPNVAMTPGAPGAPAAANPAAPPPPAPRPVVKSQALSQREIDLMKLQQETQAKYIAAINELQMLKLSLEIAETNKGIMAAKLETIKNQKDIVDLLTPPKAPLALPNYTQSINNPMPVSMSNPVPIPAAPPPEQQAPTSPPPGIDNVQQVSSMPPPLPRTESAPVQEELVPYTVVSVSELQNKWNAVIGIQGNLYNVHVGDIIPADGSRVKKINTSGVTLEKNGRERKISLIPII